MEDYWVAEILNVVLDQDQLIIKIVWLEQLEAEKPVIELRLKGINVTEEMLTLLKANLHGETEVYFYENEAEKYLEFAFENIGHPDLRLEYVTCEKRDTQYTVDELTLKLKFLNEKHQALLDDYWQENRKLRSVIHRIKQELWKEIDRHERKAEFFASTAKADRFDERRQLYQKIYDWVEQFEKDETA